MKQEIKRELQTGALLEAMAGRLCCTFLSDLHGKRHKKLAKTVLARDREGICAVYGEQAYRQALQYIRSGGKQ